MKNSHKKVDVLIATGGTGGHVFPAQALAKQLLDKRYSVVFMGKGLTSNSYFARDQFKGISIDSATPFSRGISRKIFSFFFASKGDLSGFSRNGGL